MATTTTAGHTAVPLLDVRSVTKRFGGVTALDGVDLQVMPGQAAAVVGPNGAGKSTLLKAITGLYRPDAGEVRLDGRPMTRLARHRVSRAGIALAHQIPRPFRGLSVRDNVRVAAMSSGAKQASSAEAVGRVLDRCQLGGKQGVLAGDLRLLDLKRLELARALATEPRLLMLDEVAAGLVGRELDDIIALVRGIHAEGCTLLLVEHVERVVESIVDHVTVLNWGAVLAEGTPAEIAADAQVREVYLGAQRVARTTPPLVRQLDRSVSPLLELSGLSVAYGGVTALRDVSLQVAPGEVVAVLGANGAGKSTLAGATSGLVRAATGSVVLDGEDVTALPSHHRAHRGIAHVLEGRRVFADQTVDDNLRLAVPLGARRTDIAERLEQVRDTFPALVGLADRRAGHLSGGQQQMLAIGRALMSRPRLLICDEISLGLAPVAIDALYESITRIRSEGVAILLVEQSVHRALDLADRALVLRRGTPTYLGGTGPLLDDDALDAAYFGDKAVTAPSA